MQGAHGSSSSSRAHTRPAFSLSSVSCRRVLGALLPVRMVGSERRSRSAGESVGLLSLVEGTVGGTSVDMIGVAAASGRRWRKDHGTAGTESRMVVWSSSMEVDPDLWRFVLV